jgi:hypothetical protein
VLELDDRSLVAFLRHQWLFLHPLDNVATIRRLVAICVHEHNHVLPHSAFQGQTPDEMYFGMGDAVPADLRHVRPPRAEPVMSNNSIGGGWTPTRHDSNSSACHRSVDGG